MKLLIGIVSCEKYADRREGCRMSWLRFASATANLTAVFVVGHDQGAKPRLGGDTLYVPCPDDYAHLPQKTFWLISWARQQGFTHLLKCDDDTFVHIDRLFWLFQSPSIWDYLGYRWPGGYASGGAGYLLSANSMDCIVSYGDLAQTTGPEDVLVGECLMQHGYKLVHDPRFFPYCESLPSSSNKQITAHYVSPGVMAQAYHAIATKRLTPAARKRFERKS